MSKTKMTFSQEEFKEVFKISDMSRRFTTSFNSTKIKRIIDLASFLLNLFINVIDDEN